MVDTSPPVERSTHEPGESPPAADAEAAGGRDLIAELWARHHSTNVERVTTLEDAALALLDGRLTDGQRDRASAAAHKLAGSLGTFGFQAGTDAAREAELLLDQADVDARRLAELVVELEAIVDGTSAVEEREGDDRVAADDEASATATRRAVLVSRDAGLGDQLAVAFRRVGVELGRMVDTVAVADVVEREPAVSVLVDLEDAHRGLDSLRTLSAGPAVELMALASTGGVDERLAVARSRALGCIPRTLPPSSIVHAVEQLRIRRSHAGATVMAVDDDPTTLELIGLVLANDHIDVVGVHQSTRFWETLEEVQPDTLVIDIDMPVMNGVELCRMVRNDPRWHRLPIVILSAHHDADTMHACFAAGADDLVRKPFSGLELANRVTNQLDRHRLSSALNSTDPATGVSTRTAAEPRLTRMLHLAERQAQPVTVALVEIDGFAQLAAREGRAAADAVLRTTAGIFAEQLRREDLISRWGEATFLVGLYGIESGPAAERLAGLADEVRRRRFACLDGRTSTVTVSTGIARYPADGTDIEALCRAADLAGHRARQSATGAGIAGHATSELGEFEQCDVLIVDDDTLLGDLLMHTLHTQGYEVRWVNDGLEASDLLTTGRLRAKVVLLDVGLPGLDGFGVLRRLRDHGVLQSTDVVMLTARSAVNETLEALELGAVNHISKPFSVPVLMERLHKLLREAR